MCLSWLIRKSCSCSAPRLRLLSQKPKLEVQAVNFVFWFIQVLVPFFSSIYIGISLMVFVGFMGGGSYVLCYFYIYESPKITKDLKELCVNIASMFNDMGIFSASIVNLVLSNTLMKIK